MNKSFFKSISIAIVALLSFGQNTYTMKKPSYNNPNPNYLGHNYNPNYKKQNFNNNTQNLNNNQNTTKKQTEETFTILAFFDTDLIDESFDKLVKNTGTEKFTKNIVTLKECFENYVKYYGPNAKQGKQFFEIGDKIIVNKATPHITLAEVGTIETINGKKYVKSLKNNSNLVLLDDAIKCVLDTIQDCKKEFKQNYKGKNYSPKLTFEFKDGSQFMYDKDSNVNNKKTNVWIARKLKKHNANKSEKRFYILGKKIRENLKKIGLEGPYDKFEPHISIANISSINTQGKTRNTKIIDLIKKLEEDSATAISQILKSVYGNGPNQCFNMISISAGFNNTVATYKFN